MTDWRTGLGLGEDLRNLMLELKLELVVMLKLELEVVELVLVEIGAMSMECKLHDLLRLDGWVNAVGHGPI